MATTGTFAKFETNYRNKAAGVPVMIEGLRGLIRTFADLIEQRVRLSMKLPKTGRPYVRPGGDVHVASAPGEAPAVATGTLLSSIRTQFNAGGLEAEIGVFDDGPYYAGYLEGGTVRMAARPYMRPAFNAYEAKFCAAVAALVGGRGVATAT
jgi:HK97 gp10 family phage protein